MKKVALAATVAALAISASTVLAVVNQPDKGKNFKVNMMTAYEPCTAPNTTTDDGIPACTPPVRINTICGFDGGLGKVQLKSLTVGKTDFRIKMNGLATACEGAVLNFFISFRKSGTHCGIADCTMVDVIGHPIGGCEVSNHSCKLSGQSFFPGGADAGQFEILEVYAEQNGVRSFSTGLITKRP